MITIDKVREIALSFPEAREDGHFEKTSFRVKKKIFATYDGEANRLCVKLSEIDQSAFSAHDNSVVYAVPNKWGKQGWTFVELNVLREEVLTDILRTAYCEVAPVGLSSKLN